MKICVISAQVFACPPPGYSGLEMIAWQQAKGLAVLGNEVSLVAPSGSTCPGVRIIESGPPGQWDERRAYGSYWQHLLGFDAIIDSSWQKWSYILKQEGRLKAPVLGVMHAPVNTMYGSLPPVEKPCIVCISQDQANHFQALFNHDCRFCWNGLDPEFYKPMTVPRGDRFLFLARFSKIKGPLLCIEACLKAGVGLDLVGDTSITNEPEYFQECVRAAELRSPGWDVNKGKQIRIVGPATRGECVWWFSRAYALLHGNKEFREPFGLAPVEANACGCPVIAWDNGAMRETISSAWVVRSMNEFVDMINLVKNSTVHRVGFRENALRFTVESMCKRYESLCQEAIEGGGW